jgi:flagellar L-ring protein precursor FlgH
MKFQELRRTTILLALGVAAWAAPAVAQNAPDSTAAAIADSTPADPPLAQHAPRASWLSDRFPLRVGDLVTVCVDERTEASEHVSNVATGNRSMRADLNAGIGDDPRIGPAKSFGTGINNGSRDVGDAGRQAGFTAVITVRVAELSPNGIAKVSGTKKVTIDGRLQDVTLTGIIRASDVDARNQIRSDRLADAVLTYKGKKLAPRTGFVGGLLGMLWP